MKDKRSKIADAETVESYPTVTHNTATSKIEEGQN